MMEIATLTYGALASFVMASVSRNQREGRGHPPILVAFGLTLVAFSAAMGTLLLGYVGLDTLAGPA